jgi:hypothetical protein
MKNLGVWGSPYVSKLTKWHSTLDVDRESVVASHTTVCSYNSVTGRIDTFFESGRRINTIPISRNTSGNNSGVESKVDSTTNNGELSSRRNGD